MFLVATTQNIFKTKMDKLKRLLFKTTVSYFPSRKTAFYETNPINQFGFINIYLFYPMFQSDTKRNNM